MSWSAPKSPWARCALAIIGILFVIVAIDAVLAQPFGMTRAESPTEAGGLTGWILAKQAEFYRMFSGLIRASKSDGSAAYTLLGISFLYGIFHAAGPGHGRKVQSKGTRLAGAHGDGARQSKALTGRFLTSRSGL